MKKTPVALAIVLVATTTHAAEPDPAAVERGRIALTQTGHLGPAWQGGTYFNVGLLWGAPSPRTDPEGYAAAFNRRYGLHPAPYPNDGLPMGLRRGVTKDGRKAGMQIDCMACHGGSIGGTSYVGLGNSTLDLKLLFDELTQSEGRMRPIATFTLNSTRGTVNAGQVAALLMSFRNPDWSRRVIPLPLGANLPEIDTPAWWLLHRKQTMYYDGRTPAESVRTNIQFVMGEKTLDELKALEPVFADIRAYLLSLRPPKYPFPIDAAQADRGKAVFDEVVHEVPRHLRPRRRVPERACRSEGDRHRSGSGRGDAPRKLVEHYNSTWFGEQHPGDLEMNGYQAPPLDGIWATAPYLHNGSVPTLHALLKSTERPNGLPPPAFDRLQGLRQGQCRLGRRAALARA